MLNVCLIFQTTSRKQLFNPNMATLVPLNSTKLNEINNVTTNKTYLRSHNDENGSVESYATFQV